MFFFCTKRCQKLILGGLRGLGIGGGGGQGSIVAEGRCFSVIFAPHFSISGVFFCVILWPSCYFTISVGVFCYVSTLFFHFWCLWPLLAYQYFSIFSLMRVMCPSVTIFVPCCPYWYTTNFSSCLMFHACHGSRHPNFCPLWPLLP